MHKNSVTTQQIAAQIHKQKNDLKQFRQDDSIICHSNQIQQQK